MRFDKGTRVKVMKKTDMPIIWHEAEVLAGDGHSYSVRYGYHPGTISESVVETVSWELVRPCPPRTQGMVTWRVGDIVEVFGDFCWKTASIMKVLQGDEYFVRILGTASELTIQRLNIRERCLWQDDKWILMGKSFGACGVIRNKNLLTSNFNSKISFMVPQSKKREKIGASTDVAVGCSLAESIGANDFETDPSFVGSCSIVSKRQKRFHNNFQQVSCWLTGSFCSDAESFCGPENERESCSPLPPKEEETTSVHDLELHAYHRTLEALHASGPLSWEQETLLTNLRFTLHISNDEHLVELRKLLFAKPGSYIRSQSIRHSIHPNPTTQC